MTGAHWVRRAAGSPPGNSPRRARRAHQTAHPAGAFITATPAGPSAAAGRARSRLARQSQDRQCARAARASPDRQATHHARTVAAASNASLGRADQAVLYASPRLGRPHASTATGSSHDLTAAYLEHRQDRVLQRTVPAGAAEGTRRRLSGVPYRAPCGNPHRAAVTDGPPGRPLRPAVFRMRLRYVMSRQSEYPGKCDPSSSSQ